MPGIMHRFRSGAEAWRRKLETGGIPIGVLPAGSWGSGTVVLSPGDAPAIYTDGVIEAVNEAGDEYGELRLTAIPGRRESAEGTAAGTLNAVLRSVDSFSDGAAQYDDITLLLMRVTA